MNAAEILSSLKALGNQKVRAHNTKFGAGDNQFGVKMGDIRTMAKKIKVDHELGRSLWATGNVDARFVACLIMDPQKLTAEELSDMACSEQFTHVTDWLYTNLIKDRPDKEALRIKWMADQRPMLNRLAWSLTSSRIVRDASDMDLGAILTQLENEMPTAPPNVQWTMNYALANIGIHHAAYRERALQIGERLGIYRDYPVSKGCVSPFAPTWINEMVKRQ